MEMRTKGAWSCAKSLWEAIRTNFSGPKRSAFGRPAMPGGRWKSGVGFPAALSLAKQAINDTMAQAVKRRRRSVEF